MGEKTVGSLYYKKPSSPSLSVYYPPPMPPITARLLEAVQANSEPIAAFWTPEPIFAYRYFNVVNGVPYPLYYHPTTPHRSDRLAHCAVFTHEAPQWGCRCGYYAWKTDTHSRLFFVRAEVKLTGLVIEHEYGYRSQYQEIVRLG